MVATRPVHVKPHLLSNMLFYPTMLFIPTVISTYFSPSSKPYQMQVIVVLHRHLKLHTLLFVANSVTFGALF